GGFMEVIGDGDPAGPIEGRPLGLAHLDSLRCTRTGDPTYPVTYNTPDERLYKLHRSRVVYVSSLPSAREEMHGVGLCAVSRCLNVAQNLVDIATYKQEKLGSRPWRGILLGRGVDTAAIEDVLSIAGEQLDAAGMSIYSRFPVLGNLEPDADLRLVDLSSPPDGFNEEVDTRLGMFAIAMAFGVPVRWIWPAQTTGATKADAEYQHIAGLGGGIGLLLRTLTVMLGGDPRGSHHSSGKFLPSHLKLIFDFQDDQQDAERARTQEQRAKVRTTNLEAGVVNVRTAREQALEAGDLTQPQFDKLELEDGRLPTGESVLSLFHATDEPFLGWLDLGVDNPLSTSANDALRLMAEMDVAAVEVEDAATSKPRLRQLADQAQAALGALKELYAPLAQQQVQRQMYAMLPGGGGGEGGLSLEGEPEQGTESTDGAEAAKGYDWGVGAGEVIGGQLARGASGRFVNVAQMMDQVRADMLARLGPADAAPNSAALLRMQNRSDLAAKLGMAMGVVENLAAMRTGDADPSGYGDLLSRGLARENDDGSVTMSPQGRALVKALNAGDIDSAKQAIADASAVAAAAAKPKKAAAGGKKPKGSSGKDDSKQVQENIDKIVPELPVTNEQFQRAFDFYESGAEPPAGELAELAQLGLLEITSDGIGKATATGAALVRAVKKGDARAAKDACTAGAEDVENKLDAADRQEENSVLAEERADQVQREAQSKATANAARSAALQERLTAAEGAAATAEARERVLDASLVAAQVDLDAAREMEDNAPNDIAKAHYTREREAKERAVAGLSERLEQARDLLDRKLDLASSLGSQISDLDATTATMLSNGLNQANAWREQATALREQADTLRTSVGNASRKALGRTLGGLAGAFKKLVAGRRSKARGKPSRFTIADTTVTENDIVAAIAQWETDGLPSDLLDGQTQEH
ncbi:MAG: hypothetical protein WC683_17720, partial [bacterium]